jgi:hypothetical protein
MSWVSRAMKVDSVQVSSKLRRETTGFIHWCPACEEMHPLPDSWTFDGNLNAPTFTPSFKHTYHARGADSGWGDGEITCHYFLTAGTLNFCSDCSHPLNGQSVPLPDLPVDMQDAPQDVTPSSD